MRRALSLGLAVAALLLPACRQGMFNQPRERTFRENPFFPDGSSARPLPEGTVARGFLREDAALYHGLGPDGKFVRELPVPLTQQLLLRGQERFNIYCSPCHGRTGDGQGMVVQRGFKSPPSYHIDRLRNQPIGYFFDVMTNGFGQMSSYASQVPPQDRWAIAAWVRTLQFSRDVPVGMLSDADRAALAKEVK